MGLLDKLWDDVVAGPQPQRGLGKLRKDPTAMDDETFKKMNFERSQSSPTQAIYIRPPPLIRSLSDDSSSGSSSSSSSLSSSPVSPSATSSPSVSAGKKESVWRSVFHPGSGRVKAMERQGSARYDIVTPNSPSIYDWMYNPDNKPKYR